MRLLHATSLLLLALFTLGGCNKANYETPESAYESFLNHVKLGEDRKAYAVLSQPTQQALQTRAEAAAKASGGAVKADPVAFFFANVPPPADVSKVSLSSMEGDVAKVSVNSSSGTSQVRMVREPTGWKIDLTQSLQQP